MTIGRIEIYRNLFLILPGVWICLTEGLENRAVCPGEAVYHYGTNKCLFIDTLGKSWYNTSILCDKYKVQKYGDITGTLATIDKSSEGFLRDYMKYIGISDAIVANAQFLIEPQHSRHFRTKNYRNCPGDNIIKYMYYLIMLAEVHSTPVSWRKTSCSYTGSAICQINIAEVVSEKSSCPSNVNVESVSDSEVTFTISPGITLSQVKVIFRAYKPCKNSKASLCGEQATTYDKFFLTKPTTIKFFEFESNTHYKAQFVIERFGGQPFDCNMTVDFKTNGVQQEEDRCNGEVVGLSILLVCSLCATVVLAVISWRLRASTGQDNTVLSPDRLMMSVLKRDNAANTYTNSGVGATKTPSNVGKSSVAENKGGDSEDCDYMNVQITAPNYDVAQFEQDENLYEV